MNAILLEDSSPTNLKLILSLAQSLGIKAKKLPAQQLNDHLFASRIEEGMQTKTVDKNDVLKALGKI